MAFVKGAWRILVGIKDALALLFLLLFFGLLYAALTYTPKPLQSVSSGALLLDLKGTVVEQPSEENNFALLSGGHDGAREYRLRDVVQAIEAGTKDGKVKAIVLNLDGFAGGGRVALSRIGAALDAARAAKKPVFAFATAYEDAGYQLASHASEIWVNPIGGVMLTGPGGTQLYYKGLMDKLGVSAHIYRVGTYKSFVEPYIRANQSDAAREANMALAGAIWHNWLDEVQKARPAAKLAQYVGNPVAAVAAQHGDVARAALAAGLVDKLGDEAEFGARVAAIAGEGKDSKAGSFATIPLRSYARAHPVDTSGGQIGVVTIAGDIVDGEAGPGTAAGDTISDLIRAALAKKNLKALVVRVDSPGGSVLASEKIRGAILDAKKKGLPVVASMGNVAASGGYWVSSAADRILAEPSTITGSIGVFGILPSFEGTLAKIGITTDGVKTTPLSGEPNVAGGISKEFDTLAQAGVEDIYRRFLTLVATSRHMPVDKVDSIAQGRVWDGGTARQIGLVDRFGGLEDAIAEAARMAKLDPATAKPVFIEKTPDWFTLMIEQYADSQSGGDEAAMPRDWLSRQAWMQRQWALQAVSDARAMMQGSAIRASCLECRAMLPVRAAGEDEGAFRALAAAWLAHGL